MNEWSTEEMQRLQAEAKKRVMEMKDKSKFAADDMNRNMEERKSNENACYNRPQELVKAIKMPVELPERIKKQEEGKVTGKIRKIFGNIDDEELEKLFILSLCLLLSSEKSDEEVILALMYILT